MHEILLKANTSFNTFLSNAEVLIERGLLIETISSKCNQHQCARFFKTTKKGRKFLLLIQEARNLIGITRKRRGGMHS